MFPLFKVTTNQTKALSYKILQLHQEFSAGVSEAHVAATVKGPEAADVDNKVYTKAFQQLLSNSPWTQMTAFSLC